MAASKKAKVALEGYKNECELVDIVNNTAVIIMNGNKVMASIDAITPINAAAREMLGIQKEPKEDKPKKEEKETKDTKKKTAKNSK